MTVSGNATVDGSCSGGTWTPTADGANLNVNDIPGCVSSSAITIGDGGPIDVEEWPASLPDAVTLDGNSTIGAPTPTGVPNAITALTVEGTAVVGTSIVTNGDQTYDGAVTLDGDATFVSGPGDVTFESTIDGDHALTVSSGGTDYFSGAIGSSSPPASIATTLGGAGVQLAANVTTAGVQNFDSNLTLAHNVTFNAGTDDVMLRGVVSGPGQLTVAGGGTAQLNQSDNGSDSYSGGTVVSGGTTLEFVAGALHTGSVTLDDGTLNWSGANTSDISSQLQIGNGGGTLDTGSNDVTFADGLGGSGPLTKTGAGTLTLNAASGSYGSRVVVNQGSVVVPSGTSVSSPVTIGSGGTLDCAGGTLSGGVTNDGGTATGAPGAPTNVTASPGFENATLSFTPGAANCYPLSYSAAAGGLTWPVSGSPATLSGLTGKDAYTFTLTESNPIGSASASSNQIVAEPYDPSVAISSPANGATYSYGQSVSVAYSCQDGAGGPGISACAGPDAVGSALPTTAVGQHSFTVTATSLDGLTASTSVTYTVLAAPVVQTPPTGQTPPNSFTVKSIRGNRQGLVTVVLASLPGPGSVTVTVRGAKLPPVSLRRSVAGKPTLTLSVPASRRLRSLLKHRAERIKVRIAYTPTNGSTHSLTRSIRLR